jgi:hypothetical protein
MAEVRSYVLEKKYNSAFCDGPLWLILSELLGYDLSACIIYAITPLDQARLRTDKPVMIKRGGHYDLAVPKQWILAKNARVAAEKQERAREEQQRIAAEKTARILVERNTTAEKAQPNCLEQQPHHLTSDTKVECGKLTSLNATGAPTPTPSAGLKQVAAETSYFACLYHIFVFPPTLRMYYIISVAAELDVSELP